MQQLFHSNAKLVIWGETEMQEYHDNERRKTGSYFNPQFVFENFIAGSVNVVPFKIASAVATEPCTEMYNPVFFYGPPGVGKTHLLYAIANSISRQYPDKKIVCIKGDQFTNELVKAIQHGTTVPFRKKYREADILLVDDIQFIAGKEATQEEFFHTFNELYENGKQIVLTADRKPSDMATLEDRLKGRFGVGIMVAVHSPDLETRVLITAAKATQMNLKLDSEIVRFIASTLSDNIRQIEGALKKIRAYRDLTDMQLTLENIRKTIDDIRITENTALITPALIIRNVCKYYGLDEDTLKGTQRSRNVSEPRQIAMYLMRQMLHLSQDEIAKIFSRERTTVLHALKQIEKTVQTKNNKLDPVLQDLQSSIAACF